MRYNHIIFDVDGTLMDTEEANIRSLQKTLKEVGQDEPEYSQLQFILGITGADALEQLGIKDVPTALELWIRNLDAFRDKIQPYGGVKETLDALKGICHLGVVTSRMRKEYDTDFQNHQMDMYFPLAVCSEDTIKHKPEPEPLLKYLELSGTSPEDVLYIGDSIPDAKCAAAAGIDFALALWGCHYKQHVKADFYLEKPSDLIGLLGSCDGIYAEKSWLSWAMELQFIAQAGLAYSKDPYDHERFQRVRDISAEIMSSKTGFSLEHVKNVFCNETGFQTPKLDTRAAIFQNDQILLVQEKNGLWAMPGGWVDVNQSIRTNTVKEVKEESGLDVVPVKLVAMQDRNLHNLPPYAYGICKAFVQCQVTGGQFQPNLETMASGYFSQDQLPPLAEDKNTEEQICLCFEAFHSVDWETQFD